MSGHTLGGLAAPETFLHSRGLRSSDAPCPWFLGAWAVWDIHNTWSVIMVHVSYHFGRNAGRGRWGAKLKESRGLWRSARSPRMQYLSCPPAVGHGTEMKLKCQIIKSNSCLIFSRRSDPVRLEGRRMMQWIAIRNYARFSITFKVSMWFGGGH